MLKFRPTCTIIHNIFICYIKHCYNCSNFASSQWTHMAAMGIKPLTLTYHNIMFTNSATKKLINSYMQIKSMFPAL